MNTKPSRWKDNPTDCLGCGRTFRTRGGALVHGRTCPDEIAREEDFTAAIEAGRKPEMPAAWRARRAAADAAPSHLYDPVIQAHNAALMQRGPQGRGGGMP